jgi:hypothetical protein
LLLLLVLVDLVEQMETEGHHHLDPFLLLVAVLETGVEEMDNQVVLEVVVELWPGLELVEQETLEDILHQKEIPEEMEQMLVIQEMPVVVVAALLMQVLLHLLEQVVEVDMQRQFHQLSKIQVLRLDLLDTHLNQ